MSLNKCQRAFLQFKTFILKSWATLLFWRLTKPNTNQNLPLLTVPSQVNIMNTGLYINNNHKGSQTSPCQKKRGKDNCAGWSEIDGRNRQRCIREGRKVWVALWDGWQLTGHKELESWGKGRKVQTCEMWWHGGTWRNTIKYLELHHNPNISVSHLSIFSARRPSIFDYPFTLLPFAYYSSATEESL